MKLRPDQLGGHLQKGLQHIYLVGGDEPLLVQEACDAIRARARNEQCDERVVMDVDKKFDWNSLLQSANSLSLFSQRRLMELRLPTGKPGDAGGKALLAYTEQSSDDDVLLIVTGKLDAATQKTKWFKAIEKAGVVIQVWPLQANELPAWINRRMQDKGLQPDRDAVAVLAGLVEGNLLACVQEIEKLHLLYGEGPVDAAKVEDSVADSARFDIYKFVDCALAGDAVRTSRMLSGLRAEGIDPVLVLWALTREMRSLAGMAYQVRDGQAIERVLADYHVWDKRKLVVKNGLKRHNVSRWWWMLRRAGYIDRMIKGVTTGNVWDELLQLSLIMAGIRTVRAV